MPRASPNKNPFAPLWSSPASLPRNNPAFAKLWSSPASLPRNNPAFAQLWSLGWGVDDHNCAFAEICGRALSSRAGDDSGLWMTLDMSRAFWSIVYSCLKRAQEPPIIARCFDARPRFPTG